MGSVQDTEHAGEAPRLPRRRMPRWIVVSGVVIYCSACWAAIWMAGSAGIEMIRNASANVP
jgi:hypothetical protein